jgi:hypothetical protein
MRYIQPEGHINTKSAAGVSCRKCGTVPNRLGVCVGWLGCLGVSRTGAGVSSCLTVFRRFVPTPIAIMRLQLSEDAERPRPLQVGAAMSSPPASTPKIILPNWTTTRLTDNNGLERDLQIVRTHHSRANTVLQIVDCVSNFVSSFCCMTAALKQGTANIQQGFFAHVKHTRGQQGRQSDRPKHLQHPFSTRYLLQPGHSTGSTG